MKKLAFLALCLPLLAGCSTDNSEPLPYEVALQPCDNSYRFTGSTILVTNHTEKSATVEKIVFKNSFSNAETISFYIVIDGYREYYTVCNLPEILKKDGQKIKFNGTTRINTSPLVDAIPVLELTAVKLVK